MFNFLNNQNGSRIRICGEFFFYLFGASRDSRITEFVTKKCEYKTGDFLTRYVGSEGRNIT